MAQAGFQQDLLGQSVGEQPHTFSLQELVTMPDDASYLTPQVGCTSRLHLTIPVEPTASQLVIWCSQAGLA